ncbi:MAG: hypothetical protein LQ350_005380 [Teloschistes chrysophthalmus]|nr:MAG: hypothetical protein LQ350_005380 [Niorma chrysophthalma]
MASTTDNALATESAQSLSDQQEAHVNADDQRILKIAQSISDQASTSYVHYDSAKEAWIFPEAYDYQFMNRAECLVYEAQLRCHIARLEGFLGLMKSQTKRVNSMIRNGDLAKESAGSHVKALKSITMTLDSTFDMWLQELYQEKRYIENWVIIQRWSSFEFEIEPISDDE